MLCLKCWCSTASDYIESRPQDSCEKTKSMIMTLFRIKGFKFEQKLRGKIDTYVAKRLKTKKMKKDREFWFFFFFACYQWLWTKVCCLYEVYLPLFVISKTNSKWLYGILFMFWELPFVGNLGHIFNFMKLAYNFKSYRKYKI